jgi:hypothetical protein
MRRIATALLACLLLAPPTHAQPPDDPLRLAIDRLGLAGPGPAAAEARESLARYLQFNLPRAFALSRPDFRHAGFGSGGDPDAVRRRALQACTEAGGRACEIVAENLTVAGTTPPAPPATPLLRGDGWEFTPDPRFTWHGPARAAGLYVFAHGHASHVDARFRQPPMHVRAFNNAGYDIVRFDREPHADAWPDRMATRLAEGLRTLRAQGWRSIACGGQSRGGWNCLQTLDTDSPPDLVVAVAPATHGTDADSQIIGATAAAYRLFSGARVPTRVALVQFAGDPFLRDPTRRAELARDRLAPRVGALLLIDRPAGFTGHGAGETTRFGLQFGPCLVRFATEPTPPTAC